MTPIPICTREELLAISLPYEVTLTSRWRDRHGDRKAPVIVRRATSEALATWLPKAPGAALAKLSTVSFPTSVLATAKPSKDSK
jgi:hypothetical protein